MKLNVDCVRSVLLELENAPYQKELHLGEIVGALSKKYSYDDICYSILKLDEAGYIKARIAKSLTGTSIVSVSDITYAGHQFLADIRTNKIWKQVKDIATDIGSDSLPTLVQIALKVVSNAISGYFAT